MASCIYIRWPKKYPTGQNSIARQPRETFLPKFPHLYRRDPATIWKVFPTNLFQCSPKLCLDKYFCLFSHDGLSQGSGVHLLSGPRTRGPRAGVRFLGRGQRAL